jgi:hypothetical protein
MYPEHEKLKAIQPKSQAIHEFVEFLREKGIHLGEYWKESDRMLPTNKNLTALVAEFFDIDQEKIEDEKDKMLEELRRANHV